MVFLFKYFLSGNLPFFCFADEVVSLKNLQSGTVDVLGEGALRIGCEILLLREFSVRQAGKQVRALGERTIDKGANGYDERIMNGVQDRYHEACTLRLNVSWHALRLNRGSTFPRAFPLSFSLTSGIPD